MINIHMVECLQSIDAGKLGKFRKGEKYLARLSKHNNLVFKSGSGNWVAIDFEEDSNLDITEFFETYNQFSVDSYHQV